MTTREDIEPTAEEIDRVATVIANYEGKPGQSRVQYQLDRARAAILAMHRRASPPAPAVTVPEGLVSALRQALARAEYKPGDCPTIPVKVATFIEEVRTLLSAAPTPPAAEAPGQEPVAVKLLEWFQYPDGEENWYSQDDLDRNLGLYTIRRDSEQADLWALIICGHDCGAFDTREEAIDVAQDDFETRVRSAIVSPPTYADAEAKGFEPSAEEIDWMARVIYCALEGVNPEANKAHLEAVFGPDSDISMEDERRAARAAILAIRSLASPAPKGETLPNYIKCDDCNGTGLALDMSGEPGICRECRGNTVVQEPNPHD